MTHVPCDGISPVALPIGPRICRHCGNIEIRGIAEIWDNHEFQIDTCCEEFHQELCAEMADDPEWAADMLRDMDTERLGCGPLRRVVDFDGGMLLDWKPVILPIGRPAARRFVLEHHEHCPPPAGDRFRASIWNGITLIGVVIVGRPVARMLPQQEWVEVNRLCVRRDIPAPLRWNACSQMYGWAAREAKRRGFERIITYTMETEPGITLKAAGWNIDGKVGRAGKSWNCPSRPRVDKTPTVPKIRWSRQLSHSRNLPVRAA